MSSLTNPGGSVFPLVFFLFPAFYVVTLGPAIIQFARVFFGQVVK